MVLMFRLETSVSVRPIPNRVETICKMENMLADTAARAMRATRRQWANLPDKQEKETHHHAN
jgi:hypothetical protein